MEALSKFDNQSSVAGNPYVEHPQQPDARRSKRQVACSLANSWVTKQSENFRAATALCYGIRRWVLCLHAEDPDLSAVVHNVSRSPGVRIELPRPDILGNGRFRLGTTQSSINKSPQFCVLRTPFILRPFSIAPLMTRDLGEACLMNTMSVALQSSGNTFSCSMKTASRLVLSTRIMGFFDVAQIVAGA